MKLFLFVLLTVSLIGFFWIFVLAPVFMSMVLAWGAFGLFFWFFPKPCLLLFWLLVLFQGSIAYAVKSGFVYVLDEVGIMTMAILLPIKMLVLRKPLYGAEIALPLFLLLLTGTVSSAVFHIVPLIVALGAALLLIKGFVLFYVFVHSEITVHDVERFKNILYGIGILTVGYGVLGACCPKLFLYPLGISQSLRFGLPALQSYLGHPGSFSALMGILVCFAAVDSVTRKKLRYFLLTAVFMTAMIFSLRRTTLFGSIAAVLFLLFPKKTSAGGGIRISSRLILLLLGICLIFSGIIFVLYKDLTVSYLSGDSPRSLLLRTGLEIAADYFPLGAGFGTYSGGMNQKFYSPLFYKYRLYTVSGLSKDNSSFVNDTFWPHIIAETGIPGMLCYVTIIVFFFRICFRALANTDNPAILNFAVTAIMILIVSLVETSKATFYEMSLWTFFYFGNIGIVYSWTRPPPLNHENTYY